MTTILAIDQGTTSSRAILFDESLEPIGAAQREFSQIYPKSGWVEHKPQDLLDTVIQCCHSLLSEHQKSAKDIAAIGITNQRETTVIWDKSGRCIYNAIVWQDRRTASLCEELKKAGHEPLFSERTGLLLDPYFSATKLKWLLDNIEGSRARAKNGELFFGTIDSYLIWHLTQGRVHKTDATNAARTMLYDIHRGQWDEDICAVLDIPVSMLPTVVNCADDFGECSLFGGAIPIRGVAGDQQAATVGQACFEPGMLKSTYGTGCFALLNTGNKAVASQNRLLTTIAYQLDDNVTYALEGSIFIAGAVVQWLRDGLKIVDTAEETQELAEASDDSQQLYLVPAFTGLGAPYWDAKCRGAIFGLTRNSGPNEFARAALESVGYQTRDLFDAMRADGADTAQSVLRVDGGMTASNWTMQFLADILDAPVDRPRILETTALGAAWLAGMKSGVYPNQQEFAKTWQLDRRFDPLMDEATRKAKLNGWRDAVNRTLTNRG